MPRIALIGTASTASFGFGLASRAATVAVDYLVIGCGGNDGAGNGYGGGGGGKCLPVAKTLSTTTTYAAVLGAGGSHTNTTFDGNTAAYGGDGAPGGSSSNYGGNGGPSGSGLGGGGGDQWGWDESTWSQAGGGGAGDQSSGGSGSVNPDNGMPQGGNGGNGYYWSYTGLFYGGGGGGWWLTIYAGDHNGASGAGQENYGGGSSLGDAKSGAVIVTYVNQSQLWTGGTVTSTGSGASTRWFHTITSNTSLVPKYS